MKPNMLILAITSVAQLIFILWHMFKYRKAAVAISFIVFGLIFGIVRSNIINFIQISTNHSLLPYQLRDSLLQIGNDSLQVYVGWIIAAYYAWCFAEIILKKQGHLFKKKNLDVSIFAILSVSFIFIASFCYMVETTASYMGWWSWNSSLSSGFESSLFVNVPWVGVIDWATVAFEYLGVFLITKYVIKTKQFIFLLILLFPILHWVAHINFGNFYWIVFGSTITISIVAHLLIPISAALTTFIRTPVLKKTNISYKPVWIALIIGIAVCLLSDIFVGKSIIGLISLIPISLLILLALGVRVKKIFYICIAIATVGLIFFTDLLTRKRIIMSFFPMAYFASIYLAGITLKLFKQSNKTYRRMIICTIILLIIILGWLTVRSISDQTQNTKSASLAATKTINDNEKYLLLVTLDTTRNDHTGLGGYKLDTTPNLDKISKDGVYFSNARSPVPLTYPAHMSLFTGLYPKSLGIEYNSYSNTVSQPTLAELFHNKGYSTAAFVSTDILEKSGAKKGFDAFNFQADSSTNSVYRRRSDNTNKVALDWLDDNYTKPFFMWVHYYDAHQPYDTYCDKSYSLNKSPDQAIFKDGEATIMSPTPTQKDYEFLMSRYDEEIACQDQQLGKLTDKLKDLEIYNETNIIIASDHGENFDHGALSHGQNLYEGAIRVPLVIKPGNSPEKNNGLTPFITIPSTAASNQNINNSPVLLIDLFPTIVRAFELADNLKTDGYSLQDNNIPDQRDLFFETTSRLPNDDAVKKKAVLQGQSKLIVDSDNSYFTNPEAYNINVDKGEINNIWDPNDNILIGLRTNLNTFIDTADQ